MTMILVKRSKTLQVLRLMYLEEKESFSVFRQEKKHNGWVSGGRTENLYSITHVALVSTTGHVSATINCICLTSHQEKTYLRSLFQVKKRCQVSTGDEPVQHEEARMVLKRRRPQYFDKRQ